MASRRGLAHLKDQAAYHFDRACSGSGLSAHKRRKIFERNAMGEEVVLHCDFEQEDGGAMPGDLSIDFAFVCGGARQSGWQWPPKCVRVSVRVS